MASETNVSVPPVDGRYDRLIDDGISDPHTMRSERIARDRLAELAAVAALLALHGWLAISTSGEKSATFDEVAHLGGGYFQWADGDYRFNAESGVLVQRWAAWPLLALGVRGPAADHPARDNANVWVLGQELLYGQGNDAQTLLTAGRGMITLLSMLLGGVVYGWSRALFGRAGALLSVGLYALSPTLLAHARLVTADLAAALFFLLATGAIWRLLERVTPIRLAAAAAATAGLLLLKMSGLLILPVAAVLILVRLGSRRGLEIAWGSWRHEARTAGRRLATVAVLAMVTAGLVALVLWGAYGFRFSAARPDGAPASTFLHPWESTGLAAPVAVALGVARHLELLPEAYLWGLAYTLRTTGERDAFLRGRTSDTGWWWFFPYAVTVKTPLALFGLLGLAAAAWRWAPWRSQASAVPLWTLLAVYWLFALSSHLNIGHRHMLPTYPLMFIFAGAAGRWLRRRSLVAAGAVLVCAAAFAWESWAIRPHYLSYFNQLAGGPQGGYRHLVDSSLDWGQDLPGLAAFATGLDGSEPLYAAYFGAARPAYYGMEARWLYSFFPLADPTRPPVPLEAGIYCVSVTLLQSMHMELRGPWNDGYEEALREHRALVDRFVRLSPTAEGRERLLAERSRMEWIDAFRTYDRLRTGRLFQFLLAREPEARIGYSIHVYRLSADDVVQASGGPLPEWPAKG